MKDDDRAAAADRKIIQDINTYGWHVMRIMPERDEPGWAFSIGLFRNFGHPELLLFGLDADVMQAVINIAGKKVKEGTSFSDGAESDDLLVNYKCVFRVVDKSWYRNVLGYALWFHGDSQFPVLQIFWPDKQHRFPWQPGSELSSHQIQPLLFHRDADQAGARFLLEPAGDNS
jgi:hypothetical protein